MHAAFIILGLLAIAAISIAIYYWIKQKKAPTRDRIGLANSVASTLLAAMAVVVSALGLQGGGSEQNQSVAGQGNITINGNAGGGVCAYVTGPCPSNLPQPDDLADMSASQAAAQLRKIRTLNGSQSDPALGFSSCLARTIKASSIAMGTPSMTTV